jgi:hypothetical protein
MSEEEFPTRLEVVFLDKDGNEVDRVVEPGVDMDEESLRFFNVLFNRHGVGAEVEDSNAVADLPID